MFGFSIQKLIFTVAIIAAVWYGFKWVSRMKVKRDEEARQRLRRDNEGGAGAPASNPTDAEEMIECKTCGAFVASVGATACGREDCPYPG